MAARDRLGQLYASVLVPETVAEDGLYGLQGMAPYVIAHMVPEMLTREKLGQHYGAFLKAGGKPFMEEFADWLEEYRGYLVLGAGADGLIVLDTDREQDCQVVVEHDLGGEG